MAIARNILASLLGEEKNKRRFYNTGAPALTEDPTAPPYYAEDPQTPERREPVPQSQDASTIPVEDRMRAVMESAAAADGGAVAASSSPEPPVAPAPARPRSAQLQEERETLRATPAKDQNGRMKSVLLNMLAQVGRSADRALEGAARSGRGINEYDLAGMGGAALGGGISAAVDPAIDEKIKREAKMDNLAEEIQRQLQIEKHEATMLATQTKNSPEAQAAKITKQEWAELKDRMRAAGNKVDPRDTRAVALAQKYGVHGKQGGAGFNWQSLRIVRGSDGVDRPVRFRFEDGQLHGEYVDIEGEAVAPMSERDEKTLALQLARENRERAEDGLGPVQFGGAPAAAPAAPDAAPSGGRPRESAAPAAAPQPAPETTGVRPRGAVLAPTGEPPEKITPTWIRPRSGRRRSSGRGTGVRSSSAGASSDRSTQIANGQILSTIRDFEEAKEAAAVAARRGRSDESREHLQRARAIAQELKSNPNTAGLVEVGEDAQGNPYVKRKAQRAHASVNRVAPDQFSQAVKQAAEDHGVDEATAAGWFESLGYSPAQR